MIRAAHAKEKQLPEELVQLPESPLGLVKHNNVLTEGLSARRSRAELLRPALPGEAT